MMRAPQKETACRVGARQTVGTAKITNPDFHPNSTQAQRARLLTALRAGAVTTIRARHDLEVMHPAARVMELREAGHRVRTTWSTEPSACGRLHRVARYVLVGGAQ